MSQNDERRPARNAAARTIIGRNSSARYPQTTGLAAWTVVMTNLLNAAADQLDPEELEVLLDCVGVVVARETTRRLLAEPARLGRAA